MAARYAARYAGNPHLAGNPQLIPLPEGEFGAPPGYRAFAMRVGS